MIELPPSAIRVTEDRQRSDLDLASLKISIAKRGIVTPIVVTSESPPRLIAGERRLRSAIELGLATVPVRFLDELDPIELEIIELEENIKRKDLTWQEAVRATERIHRAYTQATPAWSQSKTSESIGLDAGWVSKQLRVARDLDDPNVAKSGTVNEAYNLLSRRDERAKAAELDRLLSSGTEPPTAEMEFEDKEQESSYDEPGENETTERILPANKTSPETTTRNPHRPGILQADFASWWRGYAGPKFNLIHCDFPYGVELFGANGVRTGPNRSQMGRDEGESYGDEPGAYERLVEELCEAIPKIASSSCHLVFWFSNKWEIERRTRETFTKHLPGLRFAHYPLVWLKSDNAGIASIPDRQPRHIYEVALFGSIGDRPIVRLKSDAYSAPTDKSLHTSCKPEAMLRHFFEMLVDEHTVMLDPTCGSGSSVRAAESLGAKFALGLEIDPAMAELAERRRTADAAKRQASMAYGK